MSGEPKTLPYAALIHSHAYVFHSNQLRWVVNPALERSSAIRSSEMTTTLLCRSDSPRSKRYNLPCLGCVESSCGLRRSAQAQKPPKLPTYMTVFTPGDHAILSPDDGQPKAVDVISARRHDNVAVAPAAWRGGLLRLSTVSRKAVKFTVRLDPTRFSRLPEPLEHGRGGR